MAVTEESCDCREDTAVSGTAVEYSIEGGTGAASGGWSAKIASLEVQSVVPHACSKVGVVGGARAGQ